ncbi:NAD(P)H-dependent flavin oxidoreductase [Actinomadura rupiterrae]|uniref:NAD(P)H-dependent flavin oxidoreductase n=1 Tax=Actinomadura rupiterrae TaxID=559627 RepID=UPI0020A3AF22|nr:nitronate monooxygenase [Actinomadura rupiterrae]MCP2343048.1 nitronate monooxygenase [Actinomadura rupiterrae]
MGEAVWAQRKPVVLAPMAGGAGRPELVAAVVEAGGQAFLPAGYKTAAQLRNDIEATRALTGGPFGVNLFMPSHDDVDDAAVAAYRDLLADEAADLDAELGTPKARDDDYDAKVEDLLADPPALVSFTFGCPSREVVRAFRRADVTTVVTVTTVDEARQAVESGADALCVQGTEAGAHRGSFTNTTECALPLRELLPAVRAVTGLPLFAAGGIGSAGDVAEVLDLGAVAAQVGTLFLRCPESGATPVAKAALADPRFTETAVTRAFSGRPARGLVNRFLSRYSDEAPAAYPDVHYITSPLRKAAAARGDADAVNLWAGTAFRSATEAPAADVLDRLTPR